MAQYDFGTIDPNTKSGTALASDLNSWRNAVHSTHSASSAPSYLVAGMLWADTTSANYELKMYDGAQWITVAVLDATNNVARVAVDPAETSYITSTTSGQIRHLIASTDVFTVRSTGVQFNIASPVIADSNNNELISFTTTASAVNQIGIANAATGGAATISTLGGDTNINLALMPKGTGNVGVNTTSPSADLSVGSITTSSGDVHLRTTKTAVEFTPSNSDAGGMDINVAFVAGGQGPLKFSIGGTERARLDASGNLGLGVTPSAWGGTSKALQFSTGGIEARSSALSMNTNAFFNGTSWIYSTSANAALYNLTNTGQHQWYYAPSGTAGNAITFTQAMTLDASGNLLVGTTSAGGFKTNITGGRTSLTTTTADSFVLYMRNPSFTDGCYLGNPGENMFAVSTANGTERLRIAALGQIGIGGANYGTSGQVLTSGGSGAAPSWASASSYTVLGTINTTSGTSQTLSGLTLTDYTALVLEFNDVAVNSGLTNFNLRINSTTGPLISGNWLGTSTDGWFGLMTINLATGVYSSTLAVVGGTIPFGAIGAVASGDCNVTTASTSVTIALSNNSFAAGSIRVYGVK